MKIAKRLLPFLLVILAVIGIGCSGMDKTDVEKVITSELDLLKNLDSATTQKYISYKELFPDATEEIELSDEVNEVFSLFFQDFNYKILDIDVDNKNETATASIRLSTIDARALAKDFVAENLMIEMLASAASQSTNESVNSLEEKYLILNQLLTENEYKTVETNCIMELKNKNGSDGTWEITRTHALENDLVGGLMTYLSDNSILSPEETLAVYLNTLKEMNIEQMSNYLGVESILNTDDEDKKILASTLVELVHNCFDYEILESETDGYTAAIKTNVTTFNSASILSGYQEEFEAYMATPEAVIDGSEARYKKALDLLLKNVEESTESTTLPTTFKLINDGVSWKLQDDGQTLGKAIFGILATTPVASEMPDEENTENEVQ